MSGIVGAGKSVLSTPASGPWRCSTFRATASCGDCASRAAMPANERGKGVAGHPADAAVQSTSARLEPTRGAPARQRRDESRRECFGSRKPMTASAHGNQGAVAAARPAGTL